MARHNFLSMQHDDGLIEKSSEEVVGIIVSCYQQFMGHSARVGSFHHGEVALFGIGS